MNTAADTVGKNRFKPFWRSDGSEKFPESVDKDRSEKNIEEVDESGTDVDRKNEHQVHHGQENRYPQLTMQNNLVDFVGNGLFDLVVSSDARGSDFADKGVAHVGNSHIQVAVVVLIECVDSQFGFGKAAL